METYVYGFDRLIVVIVATLVEVDLRDVDLVLKFVPQDIRVDHVAVGSRGYRVVLFSNGLPLLFGW